MKSEVIFTLNLVAVVIGCSAKFWLQVRNSTNVHNNALINNTDSVVKF